VGVGDAAAKLAALTSGARRLRNPRSEALGREGPGRAARERRDGAEAQPVHERRADGAGAPDRTLHLRRSQQPRSGRPALPQLTHDRLPSAQRLGKLGISSRTQLARLDLDSAGSNVSSATRTTTPATRV